MSKGKAEPIADLVEAARCGSRPAFGQLVCRFQDAVAAIILSRLGPGPDVEDVTQEVFLAAYSRLDQLREPAKFGAWVCAIGRNLALRWVRDRRLGLSLSAEVSEAPTKRSDSADQVADAVQRLPLLLREPLTMFYIDGYGSEQVAEMLEVPAGTVRRRLHRARNLLREYLEPIMAKQIKQSAPRRSLPKTILDRIGRLEVKRLATPSKPRDMIVVTDEACRWFEMGVGDREAQALEEALGAKAPGVNAAALRPDAGPHAARRREFRNCEHHRSEGAYLHW